MAREFAYVRLARTLAAQIEDGTCPVGDRLPSVRALRRETGSSAQTVCRALEELERLGLAEARPRSGWFVAARAAALPPPSITRRLSAPKKLTLHGLTDSIVATTSRRGLVPFGGTSLAPELLPTTQLARITRSVLRTHSDVLVRYGEAAGELVLRRAIARRMGRTRASQIVVTNGCMEALHLSLMASTQPGDVVALESPTFFGFLQLVRNLGRRGIEIPVDPETGIDIALFERAVETHDVKAVLVTPNYQNPLGALMPDDHKRALLDIAKRHDVTPIESDVYGDLPHGGERPRPLSAFDDDGCVLSCSSVSKTLAPGLRIGWVRASDEHRERIAALKLSGSICAPLLNQLVVADVLSTGAYDRHLKRLRVHLAAQVAAMSHAIERSFPADTRLTKPRGGFVLWVELPDAVDTAAHYPAALDAGVAFVPGAVSTLGRRYDRALRLSCGHPWSTRLEKGIERLAEVMRA